MKRAAVFRVCPPTVLGYVRVVLRVVVSEMGKSEGVWVKSEFCGKSKNLWGKKMYHGGGPTQARMPSPARGRMCFGIFPTDSTGPNGEDEDGRAAAGGESGGGCGVVGCGGEAVCIVRYRINSDLNLSSDPKGKQWTLHPCTEKCCSEGRAEGAEPIGWPGTCPHGGESPALNTMR